MSQPSLIKLVKIITISLSAVLAGCATTSPYPDVQEARTSIWVRENIAPIMESEPARAASMLASRFQPTCTNGIELSSKSFYAHFKDTEKYADYKACNTLNGNLTVAYWKAGNHSAIKPHLMQVLWDGFNTPRSNYGETWCMRHRHWNIYTGASFEHYKAVPPWHEMHAIIFPKEAAKGYALYKRYFCTIHYSSEYSGLGSENIIPIRQEIEKNFGKKAIEDIERYNSEILGPLLSVKKTIMQRNIGKEVDLQSMRIEEIALYRNALQHVQRMGLDKVIYNGDPVFVSHLNSLISEAEVNLKRDSR